MPRKDVSLLFLITALAIMLGHDTILHQHHAGENDTWAHHHHGHDHHDHDKHGSDRMDSHDRLAGLFLASKHDLNRARITIGYVPDQPTSDLISSVALKFGSIADLQRNLDYTRRNGPHEWANLAHSREIQPYALRAPPLEIG